MGCYDLRSNVPEFLNEMQDVIRLFDRDAVFSEDGEPIFHTHAEENGMCVETAACGGVEPAVHTSPMIEGELERARSVRRASKTSVFLLFRRRTGIEPPWGSLTGIRPTRLFYEALESGMTDAEAEAHLTKEFYVSPEKASLIAEIVRMQKGFYYPGEKEFDVYAGIPFCTTRCAYCSFSSGEIGNGKRTDPYVDAIRREIAASARITDGFGLKPRAIYVGGGTPTSLSAEQLRRVLEALLDAFPGARELTVEAGRPDTITRGKLQMLTEMGVTRISVNPQTFSDVTLERIGRAHSAADTVAAYELAREMGFDHINMDLIAALPGESVDDFMASLEETISLDPESITVHSLAIKRSSRLHERLVTGKEGISCEGADEMITKARLRLGENGYHPYYLYRQKYMAGNLENVGYAKTGHACLYNIGNMEETARVLALGAGAITKWLFPRIRRIDRAPNVKNIDEYIARVDEMVERKRLLITEG